MPDSQEDFKKYLDPSIISRLNNIDLKAKLVVEGFMVGLHKSPFHGFSVEFSQHRPYNQGDDLKNVDWKVYAKSDRYYIRQYEEETNLKCNIVLDVSKSMNYASKGNISKLEYSTTLAAALSYLMIKQQDAVGLTLYSDVIENSLPPKASKTYLVEMLKILSKVKPSNKTNTALCLNSVADKMKKKGMVIIISDFFDDLSSVVQALKHFRYNSNDVIIFQIIDPLEKSFAFGNDSVFIDLESQEKLTTQPIHIQKAYQESFKLFLDTLKKECLNSNIDYNLIQTNETFDKALFKYIQKRIKLN